MSRQNMFRTNYRGRGKWRIVADALNQIGEVLNNVTINGRDARVTSRGMRLMVEAGGGVSWPGVVWQKGFRYYDPTLQTDHTGTEIQGSGGSAKSVLAWYIDNSAAPFYSHGPIPNPLPTNMEMEYVENLGSAIHVH